MAADDNLKAFMLETSIGAEEISYVASNRFKVNNKPVAWKIRALNSSEDMEISNRCKKKTFNQATKTTEITINQTQYADELMCKCITYPNLDDAALQDHYNAVGAADLLKKMLKPGEYADLLRAVQEANGFDVGMDEKVTRAKN